MKRIAVLVAGAFLLQQFAPTMLWAEGLATAIADPDTLSYTLPAGGETITESLPAYPDGKTEFTVNGGGKTLQGNDGVKGIQVGQGETLNLNNITLTGFSNPVVYKAVINDGTVVANGDVTNNESAIAFKWDSSAAPQPSDYKGTLIINGNFNNAVTLSSDDDAPVVGIAQRDLVVNNGATLTTDLEAAQVINFTNQGTVQASGGSIRADITNGDDASTGILYFNGDVHNGNFNPDTQQAQKIYTITQKEIHLADGKHFNNLGTVTAELYTGEGSRISNAAPVVGAEGKLIVLGGENKGDIGGDATSYGTLIVKDGTFVNNGSIHQQTVSIDSGTLQTNLSGFNVDDGSITNNGTLVLSNATAIGNNYDISGTGTLVFTGGVDANYGLIEQGTIQIGTAETPLNFQNRVDKIQGKLINYGNLSTGSGAVYIFGTEDDPSYNYGTIIGGDGPINANGIYHVALKGYMINQGTIDAMRNDGGTLETAAGGVGNMVNRGTVILGTGTNTGAISYLKADTGWTYEGTTEADHPDGTVIVRGDVINADTGLIKQETISVEEGSSLKSNAGTLEANITNDGVLTFTGGTNYNSISGTGTLNIHGADGTTVANSNTTIDQAQVNIAANNTFEVGGSNIHTAQGNSVVTNEGRIDTNSVVQMDELVNKNSVFVNDGVLEIANLDNQAGAQIQNAAGLMVTNGTNSGSITENGHGELDILGEFANTGEGSISHSVVRVREGAQFTTAADKVTVTGSQGLSNGGTLILTGSEEGLTNNNKIQGGGDLIIRDGKVINADGKTIDQKIIVAAADTTAGTTAGNFTAFVKDFRTADMENNAVATLKGFNDSSEEPQNFLDTTLTGTGDLYISGTVVAGREITQGSVNLEGNEGINQLYNLKNGHVQADINTAATARIYNRGTLTITGGENSGNILDDRETKEGESESKIEITGGKFTNTGIIKQDVINVLEDGEFQTAQNTLILPEDGQISNNGILTITGDGEGGSALRVGKNDLWEGPAKTVITGALDNVERIYQDTLFITKDGSLEMDIGDDYSKFNVANVLNNGTFTLTGGTIQQNINYDTTQENASKLVISTGGVKVANEDITLTQKNIEIGENGDFAVKTHQLVAEKIINNGNLEFQGGTPNTTKIDGTGELSITEDVTNNAHIDQRKVVVDGGVTFTHSGNEAEDTPYVLKANVENDGTVQNDAIITAMNDESKEDALSQSSINHEGALFTGKGTLRVGGNFYNEGTLQQNAIIVLAQGDEEGTTQDGHFITAVDSVKANITNNGLLTLRSGATGINTNTIDGDNGTLELKGNITNNGSITQNKLDTNGNTLTNNGTLSFNEAGDNNIIVGSGNMEITGNVTQSGTLQQGSLTIADGATYTVDLDNISVNTLVNDGTIVANEDATLENEITGTGMFKVAQGAIILNDASLTQGKLAIESGVFTTYADKVTAPIENSDTLILIGGTNANNITGLNGYTQINGDVTNTASIMQDALTVTSGKLNTSLEGLNIGTLTNNATLELTGGTLSQQIGKDVSATNATTNILGDVTVAAGGLFDQNAVTVKEGGALTADMAALVNAGTFTNDGAFNAGGTELTRAINGKGEMTITSTMGNTAGNAINQKKLTVDGAFTTAANVVTAQIVNNGTLTLTEGTNNNAITNNANLVLGDVTNNANITGTGTLEVDGNVTNNNGKTIENAVTINATQTLTAYANDILGNVNNNGIFAVTGGTLQQASLGGETQILGNVALAQATAFNNVLVAAGQTLGAGENSITANDMTLNGSLGMSWTNLAKDASTHDGATLTVSNKLTLGADSKLLLTFVSDTMQLDDETGWMNLVEGGATIDGTLSPLSQNARYEITRDENDQNKIKVKYTITPGEAAKEAGANDNEAAVADAWNEEISNPDPVVATVAGNLNTISQDTARQQEYVEALESLAPVQVAMTKANVSNLNQGIYTVANNHMSGGVGMAAGEEFSYKSVWMQGMFNNTKYDVEGGFDGNTYGGAVGLDVSNDEDTTLGIGYAYAYSSLNATGKKIKADTQNIFLYGNYTGLENWYFDGTIGYNFGKYNEDKTVTGITGHGKYNVNSFAAQAMAQYAVNEYFSPLAGLRYVWANQGAYTDGFGQKMDSTNDHTLTALLGVKAGKNFQAGKLVLKPLFKLAATFDVMQHGDDVTVTMSNSSYKVQSEQLKKFGAEAGFSLGMDLTDQVELTLGYDGQFRSHYYNHTGSAKLKYSF